MNTLFLHKGSKPDYKLKTLKRIIIATDSFKGSLSSAEAGNAIEAGILDAVPEADVKVVPVADGGEGTAEALCRALSGTMHSVNAQNPLGRPVNASYCIAGDLAVMEMSQASGLTLLRPEERNPMQTSTYGTGQMILDALRKGCRRFLIGIGGSATNDGGTGMLEALGFRFIDNEGCEVHGCGASLHKIASADCSGAIPELAQCHFSIACDVDTPFCGPDGASRMFAPQKGADAEMAEELERGMESFAEVIERFNGVRLYSMPGSGAAGGLGGAFTAFLGAELESGAETVLDTLNFSGLISGCSLVVTGEGRMDRQTVHGKTPAGVLKCASAQGIPVIAFCGKIEDRDILANAGFSGIYEIDARGLPLQEAMKPDIAAENLRRTAYIVFQKSHA